MFSRPGRSCHLLVSSLVLFWLLTAAAAQEAVKGEVLIEKPRGFGRIVLSFPVPLVAKATVAGGVAVVRFDRPVILPAERIASQLPAYISAARLDPDRRALRIALAQSLRADLKDGAEQVFLDLLPLTWRGPPPPLPADVAARLAQRARAAQAAAGVAPMTQRGQPAQRVQVALARSTALMRLTFALPPGAAGRTEIAGERVAVAFEGAVRLDEEAIRSALAGALDGLQFETGGRRLSFALPSGKRVAGLMEDGAFALDLADIPVRTQAEPPDAGTRPATPAQTAAAGDATGARPQPESNHEPARRGAMRLDSPPRVFDADAWAKDRRGAIRDAWYALVAQASEAPKRERLASRMRLASFQLANGLAPEAGAVLAALGHDDPRAVLTRPALLMRALALLIAERGGEAAAFLNAPALADDAEAALLRAWMAFQSGQSGMAHAGFSASAEALPDAPEALQGMLLPAAIEAALEVRDLTFADRMLAMLERLDARERDPAIVSLYRGRIAAEQGQEDAALALYDKARGGSRPIEAQARLHKALLAHSRGKLPAETVRAELETVGMIWRRGRVEALARVRLAEMAIGEGRWRDAFAASRRAVEIQPELAVVRGLQDDMARRFEALFLEPQAGGLSRIEALAIFEEFRALIPPGPRGDEIVRRLAEQLVALDLTAQAAELLTYQMEHRLKGMARAETGARLAVLYLDDGLPNEALAALRGSRSAGLPPELARVRVELEARALGELGRTELALELLARDDDADAGRARADILWRAKRWNEAAETYEQALTPVMEPDAGARVQLLRAAMGHVLAGDRLGTHRLRELFGARMAATPDGPLFEAITTGNLPHVPVLGAAARASGASGVVGAFLAAYRKRFAERNPEQVQN